MPANVEIVPAAREDIAGPTPGAQRIEAIDVLRGVAVLMIFVVNIKSMAEPMSLYFAVDQWASPIDQWVARLQHLLVDEKFFTIFTALFGCGLALFCERAEAAQRSGSLIYRRLAVLLAIGMAHGALIWFGDVLALYAIAGFVALPFLKASPRQLYAIAFAFLVARVAIEFSPLPGVVEHLVWGPAGAGGLEGGDGAAERAAYLGGVGQQFSARLSALAVAYTNGMLVNLLRVVALMLAGIALYRQGFFSGRWPMRAYLAAIAAAVACTVVLHGAAWGGARLSGDNGLWATLRLLSLFTQAFAYSAIVIALVKHGARLGALAAVGRMALTNYIACSLIGTTIFYGHGLALYGSMGPAGLMLVVVATWAVLLVLSPYWLARFRYGPLEWAWRSLTYGRAVPIRAKTSSAGTAAA